MISGWADSCQHKYQDNITKLNPVVFIWYHKPFIQCCTMLCKNSNRFCNGNFEITLEQFWRLLALIFSASYYRPPNLPTLVSSRELFVAISGWAEENLSQLISTWWGKHKSTLILSAGKRGDNVGEMPGLWSVPTPRPHIPTLLVTGLGSSDAGQSLETAAPAQSLSGCPTVNMS